MQTEEINSRYVACGCPGLFPNTGKIKTKINKAHLGNSDETNSDEQVSLREKGMGRK